MKTTTIVLLVLTVTALTVGGTPVMGEDPEPEGDGGGPCVKFSTDPPGVLVNPSCLDDYLPPPPSD